VRLFLAGEEVEAAGAAEVLAPLALAELEQAGLVARTAGTVRARVLLAPFHGVLVAGDPWLPGRLRADHVVAPGQSSETLAKLTIRTPVRSALDLCAGSGVQALLAAAHCERVIGTDLNPRALALAELGAALNGIENIEWRQGDLFEPVAAESFELVVANPPFVVSPVRELTFRDSGRLADELSRDVVSGIAAVLADGGFGHVLCAWVPGEGEPWPRPPAAWLDGSGCDVLILRLEAATAESYAVSWTSLDAATTSEAVQRAASWVEHYREIGIREIVTGLVVMRRRTGPNWVAAEQVSSIGWGAGEQLARIFAGRDALERLGDERSLKGCVLSLAPGARLVQRWRPGRELERARLALEGGLGLGGAVAPPGVADVFHVLDGRRTLQEAAEVAGIDPGELDHAIGSIRALIERGYLLAAQSAPS
jgi:ubiquinone/menaquinone biosynthesis C-methylase UbiE